MNNIRPFEVAPCALCPVIAKAFPDTSSLKDWSSGASLRINARVAGMATSEPSLSRKVEQLEAFSKELPWNI
jgi:hypothetical protein